MLRILLILLLNLTFADEVYQYKDKTGNLVVTNKKQAGSTKLDLPPIAIYTNPITKSDAKACKYTDPSLSKNQTSIYFGPREEARKKILQEELDHEKIALKKDQETLEKTSSNNKGQSDSLKTDIAQHQKNIDMLIRQLSE